MNIEQIKTVEVKLTMSETEARWLMLIMQNPFNLDGDPSQESEEEHTLRAGFFTGLKAALE